MDDDGAYLRAGLPRDLQKKLRQIHWTIEEELDLHGLTAEGAEVETTRFLAECRRLGVRCVRIIHGKGLRSAGGEPVLKGRVRAHLARHPAVLAFVEPHAPDGGSGAVLVLLEA